MCVREGRARFGRVFRCVFETVGQDLKECESGDRALFCAADYNSKMGDKKLFFQKVNRFFQEVE